MPLFKVFMYKMEHDYIIVEAEDEESATMKMYETHGDWDWDSTEEVE
jgi:hypothetical protein